MCLWAQLRALAPGQPSISVIAYRGASMPDGGRPGSLAGSANGILPKAYHDRRNPAAVECRKGKKKKGRALHAPWVEGMQQARDSSEGIVRNTRAAHQDSERPCVKSSGRSQSGEIVDLSLLPATARRKAVKQLRFRPCRMTAVTINSTRSTASQETHGLNTATRNDAAFLRLSRALARHFTGNRGFVCVRARVPDNASPRGEEGDSWRHGCSRGRRRQESIPSLRSQDFVCSGAGRTRSPRHMSRS